LIQLKWEGDKSAPTRFPVGLLDIASYSRQKFPELDFSLIDMPSEQMDSEAVLQKIREERPQVIGMSLVTAYYGIAKEIAGKIKKEFPDILLVAGGPHVSALPEHFLKNTVFDIAVVGEGEARFSEVIDAFGHERSF